MLAKSKLNSTEKLVSRAIIDLEISHDKQKSFINQEQNYRTWIENIRIMKVDDDEKDELSENNKNIRKKQWECIKLIYIYIYILKIITRKKNDL